MSAPTPSPQSPSSTQSLPRAPPVQPARVQEGLDQNPASVSVPPAFTSPVNPGETESTVIVSVNYLFREPVASPRPVDDSPVPSPGFIFPQTPPSSRPLPYGGGAPVHNRYLRSTARRSRVALPEVTAPQPDENEEDEEIFCEEEASSIPPPPLRVVVQPPRVSTSSRSSLPRPQLAYIPIASRGASGITVQKRDASELLSDEMKDSRMSCVAEISKYSLSGYILKCELPDLEHLCPVEIMRMCRICGRMVCDNHKRYSPSNLLCMFCNGENPWWDKPTVLMRIKDDKSREDRRKRYHPYKEGDVSWMQ